MKKGRLKEIVSELQNASKMHLAQSKEIEKHIDAKRRKAFCARSKSWDGERGKAARRRWKC